MPAQIAPPRPKSSLRTTTTTNTAPAPAPPTPVWTRKRDFLYLIFFLIHIPTVLFVDLYAIYPAPLRLQFMTDLRTYYIRTYRDQFSISPPAWFTAYMWMEALYHLPMSVWAVRNLVVGSESPPLFPPFLTRFPPIPFAPIHARRII
ncbi:Transmembrane protein 6/97 [Lasallia pustulata]|uniref:Transmembrane protein 6/97 n=1 Tax=Lasallia pustulata TaxID=136370 RepID=A0A1W5CSB2_9LECA|nr:Transmembrane protein 6/97 [Lasallia pustulata]